LGAIDEELRKHCDNGCYRTHSGIHQGVLQLIDSNVIYKTLGEESQRHNDIMTELVKKEKSKAAEIINLLDELDSLDKDISIEESPLVSKVMNPGDVFRCIQFNAANTALNDVDCNNYNASIPFIAASKGKNIFIHDIHSGNLTAVFNGDDSELCVREPSRPRSVITCLFFQGMRIYSGSMDCLISCWDIEIEKQIFVAKGHDGSVTCLCADHEKMISGSADATLILWNKDTGAMYRKIFGHLRGVLSIECGISWCISGGSDGFIFVWKCLSCSEDPCYAEV
jgi:WD40 repeat protein